MNDLKIVKGNSFATLHKVRAFKYDGTEIEDFNLADVSSMVVTVHINNSRKYVVSQTQYEILKENNIRIDWTGKETLGKYTLEASGLYKGQKWRFFDKTPIFTIVNTNAEANIPKQSIVEEYTYLVQDDVKLYVGSSKIDPDPNKYSKMHYGEFNAGNIEEEGWYDSIVYGRPEGSESDEKYFLYQSSNGGQVCFSRRNSGKVYHRLGRVGHPWVSVGYTDNERCEDTATALYVYRQKVGVTFSGENYNRADWASCSEVYSGDNLQVTHFHLSAPIQLNPHDIIEVACFYRRGNSAAGIDTYPFDSDAYIYVSDQAEEGHTLDHLRSDFIKVKSMGSLNYPFTEEQHGWQDLGLASTILNDYGKHFVKTNVPVTGLYYLHVVGDFSVAQSWFAIKDYETKCCVHKADTIDNVINNSELLEAN